MEIAIGEFLERLLVRGELDSSLLRELLEIIRVLEFLGFFSKVPKNKRKKKPIRCHSTKTEVKIKILKENRSDSKNIKNGKFSQ